VITDNVSKIAFAASQFETQAMVALFLCCIVGYLTLRRTLKTVTELAKLFLAARERQNQQWLDLIREITIAQLETSRDENPSHPHPYPSRRHHSCLFGLVPVGKGTDCASTAGIHSSDGPRESAGPDSGDQQGSPSASNRNGEHA